MNPVPPPHKEEVTDTHVLRIRPAFQVNADTDPVPKSYKFAEKNSYFIYP
jgi:hypothetical protein